jgi:glycosyltransferase involved in cell wall biosynthesis
MRIGIDCQFFFWPPTGIYNYLWNVLDRVCRLDHPHQITLFVYREACLAEPDELRRIRAAFPRIGFRHFWDGLPPRLLSRSSDGRPAAPWWARWARQLDRRVLLPLWHRLVACESRLVAWRWRRAWLAQEVDLFHHPAGFLFPLHRKVNVMTLSDLIPRHFPQYCPDSVAWFEESFANANQTDLILTYSEHTKQDVIKVLGVAEDKIRVTPLAAHGQYRPIPDKEQIRPLLAKHDLAGRPYVLTISSLDPRKNLTRLIEAFRLVKQREPSLRHQLILAGADLGAAESVLETVRRLDLGSQVRWLGYVPFEELPALLNGADLFVFPSLYEGFGLPPLEAMACGTPVVASRSSSLPEVVGDAGLLVDPLQVEELAAAMHRVLTDRQLPAALREQGLRRARLFSWDRTARLTLAAYEEAGARHRANGRPRQRKPLQRSCRDLIRQGIIQELEQDALERTPG